MYIYIYRHTYIHICIHTSMFKSDSSMNPELKKSEHTLVISDKAPSPTNPSASYILSPKP